MDMTSGSFWFVVWMNLMGAITNALFLGLAMNN